MVTAESTDRRDESASAGREGAAGVCARAPAAASATAAAVAAARLGENGMEWPRSVMTKSDAAVVRGLDAHVGAALGVVAHEHAPGLTAHLAVLDVLLRGPAARIERDGVHLAAVRAAHVPFGVGGAIAEGELRVESDGIVWVVEKKAHVVRTGSCKVAPGGAAVEGRAPGMDGAALGPHANRMKHINR